MLSNIIIISYVYCDFLNYLYMLKSYWCIHVQDRGKKKNVEYSGCRTNRCIRDFLLYLQIFYIIVINKVRLAPTYN